MDLWALSDLETPWCIRVVATLRVADHLAAGHMDIATLAATTGTDRDSLHRVLRHLVSKGVFEETSPGRFALNELARGLLAEGSRLGLGLDSIGGRMTHAWGTLLSAVRTGRAASHKAFSGGFWEDLDCASPIIHPYSASRRNTLITVMKSSNFSYCNDRAIFHDLALKRALFAERQVWA